MDEQETLKWFEIPRWAIEPSVRALRLGNSAFDFLFYDVNALWLTILGDGEVIQTTGSATKATEEIFRHLDLGALTNPEGSVLVVDAMRSPYITRFADVPTFIEWANENSSVEAVSVSGVGSSALGSAALAWNLSMSLGQPVAAIVPGYGVADVFQQALGGWFGFGVYNWVKQSVQELLAHTAPSVAAIGRDLQSSTPSCSKASSGVPVFRRGSGSSDVLHDILLEVPTVKCLFGHSKGAFVIANAILGLPPNVLQALRITTYGCTVRKNASAGGYQQFLGTIDALGWLNSWGNQPDHTIFSWHSTNTVLPLAMHVQRL
ncbi:hypothetical protein [Cupriavidus sp. UYPR2.512]|uniref:hypothetical protein n=1 Tax=Cupriavidus sp. UYPR2.512 TaxID=1080187 RepID=UPI0012F7142D|nr:hypothetical protein [Cupriavidus sp. UYPR2.512]UIF88103.1 hypothetical protein KAF44_19515 [Cupriavidus necator]